MWSARSRLLRSFSTGKPPIPPSNSRFVKLFTLFLGGGSVLWYTTLDSERSNEVKNKLFEIAGYKTQEKAKSPDLVLPPRPATTLNKNIQSNDSKKYQELNEVIESIQHNEAKKVENEEARKRAEELEKRREKKKNSQEKQEETPAGSGEDGGKVLKEHRNEEEKSKTDSVEQFSDKSEQPPKTHSEPSSQIPPAVELVHSIPVPPESPAPIVEPPVSLPPIVQSEHSPPSPIEVHPEPAAVQSVPSQEVPVPVPASVPEAEPVESHASTPSKPVAESITEPPKPASTPIHSSSDLDSMISQIRSDLHQEQEKREKDLYNGIEDLFKTLISEYLPRSESSGSPARVISSNLDFSKMTSEQIHRKFEELINAYQDRLETLGVRNYDSFIERLKQQKDKWKQRMLELQDEYERQIESEIKSRDEKWKKVLYEEAQDSESHYETQAKIDADYVKQETELELSKKFKEELDLLTETLEKATKDRLAQLEDIMKKIKEMESIQAEHYEIIIKLTQIHKLHVAIENIQKALISDSGNLTPDLKLIIKEAKSSESIHQILEKLEPVYGKVILNGIPKVKQIQDKFEAGSLNARRAALIHSGNLLNVLMSKVAIHFIPSNIRTVDDFDTLSVLKSAEDALGKGDLARARSALKELSGLPAEEMKDVLQDIELRLTFTDLVEKLSENSIQTVQRIVNAKALY